MTDQGFLPASAPHRPTPGLSPSLLVVGQSADLRRFLRASLQTGYRIVEAPDGHEGAQHLAHCPPQGLIVGRMTTDGKETLIAALRSGEVPPVLKLWSTSPPAGWADQVLRHPFTRVDLLRAVDRLVHGEGRDGTRMPALSDLQIRANTRA